MTPHPTSRSGMVAPPRGDAPGQTGRHPIRPARGEPYLPPRAEANVGAAASRFGLTGPGRTAHINIRGDALRGTGRGQHATGCCGRGACMGAPRPGFARGGRR